ncbi:hypothetical protein AYI68_g4574 [Smittium mucronatum]|uniref:Uncharacterized protein n=1 Tax=Smittium mucronatum TaxID=133383 RepID=A0A1R0GWV8_9FUNG|nr:hypothetical protein AYI68_g4574 [Smittium mucronatum]
MKIRKVKYRKTNTLSTLYSSAGLPAAYLRKKSAIYQPKDNPGVASCMFMTQVTCSHGLSSLSTNNSSLNLLSSQSEPTSNRINKIRHLSKSGFDRHGFPTNSCWTLRSV